MLRSLYIQNYALIEKLDITFERGFSVITGETGAGKSIILGAIGLLLGQRADVKAIRPGASKCVIEAQFDISAYGMQAFFEENDLEYDVECILRRDVYASGKSRAFINDTPVSLAQMKELGEQLIDIHSQHQNLLLNKEGFQLNVLDLLAHDEADLQTYQTLYKDWRQAEQDLEKLKTAAEKSRVEQEAEVLAHAEDIKAGLYKAGQALNADEGGMLGLLKDCQNIVSNLREMYTPAGELAERLDSVYIELKDIAREIGDREETVEFNPERLNTVNERLNLLYTLEQKHRVDSVDELLALQESYASKLSAITSSDEDIERLRERCADLFKQVEAQAGVLTEARKRAAQEVECQMASRLIPLGMPNVRFQVEMGMRKEPGIHGMDTVNFLFSANKNGTLQNISSAHHCIR